ncbi:hypothetical protein FPV67DRAFT_212649 [Lyophyllum atratum]|nr:hypothetical protein FPV67DRAFT_212649 [Lyophyllum atratum]
MRVSPSASVSHTSFRYKDTPPPARCSFLVTAMFFAFIVLLALGALPSAGPMGHHLAPRPLARPTLPITPFHLFANSIAVENLKNVTSVISSPAPNSVISNLKPNSLMPTAASKGLLSMSDFTDLISVAHHSVSLHPPPHTRPTPFPIALAPILHLLPIELAGLAINAQNTTAIVAPIAASLVTPLPAKPLPASGIVIGHNFGLWIVIITVFAAAFCYWADIPPAIGRRLPFRAVVNDAATKDIVDDNPTVGAAPDAIDEVSAPEAAIIANERPLEAPLSTTGTATLHPSTRRHITTSGRRFNHLPWRRVVD